MTRSDLITIVAGKHPELSAAAVERAVNTVFDSMTDELSRGGRVEVRGFGSFSVRARRARVGRNPKTGVSINVSPKRVPFFITGVELKNRVNESRLKYPIQKNLGENGEPSP